MTYIEFFDKTALENVCACLTNVPERVIFIGDNERLIRKHTENYGRVFARRGQNIEFLCETVEKNNLSKVLALLRRIVQTYEDCVFDITGGSEILLFALGIVRAENPHRNIRIHRINLRNNRVYDFDEDGNTAYYATPVLSVEENVQIYGGDVVYDSEKEGRTYRWDMTEEFIEDIEKIWTVCKGNVRLWNTQIGILEAIEACRVPDEEPRFTTARLSAVESYLARRKISYKVIRGIIHDLVDAGLLLYFDDSDGKNVTVVYKSTQIKRILTRAGQALEMKIFAAVKQLREPDGTPTYNDALNGVVIDWDGKLHDKDKEGIFDTENEIDILMMHDMVPVFVSCKNGIFTADELYKLNTVAYRFGNDYAKKVLIATSLSAIGEAGEYLRQRAADMNIQLIENVQDMEDAQLAKKLRNLWRN